MDIQKGKQLNSNQVPLKERLLYSLLGLSYKLVIVLENKHRAFKDHLFSKGTLQNGTSDGLQYASDGDKIIWEQNKKNQTTDLINR